MHPSWDAVYHRARGFIGDLPIVAHNMAFDGYVLTDLDRLYNKEPLTNRRYCTVRLARRILPDLPSRRLDEVFEHYFPGEFFIHHQAEADAWACGKIFARMQREYGIDRLAELCPPTGPGGSSYRRPRTPGGVKKDPDISSLLEEFAGTEALHGHRVAFTGALSIAPRATLQALVEALGGVAEKSTTKKTTILVVGVPNPRTWAEGAEGSKKLRKATALREAGSPITVMSEEEFVQFLRDGQE